MIKQVVRALALFALSVCAFAQTPTTIVGPIYDSFGNLYTGSFTVQSQVKTNTGYAIVGTSRIVYVRAGAIQAFQLIPNDTSTPNLSSYQVTFANNDKWICIVQTIALPVSKTIATTSGSATITVSNATSLVVGQLVTAAGVTPYTTTVTAISGTTVTLSAKATATATGVPATFATTVSFTSQCSPNAIPPNQSQPFSSSQILPSSRNGDVITTINGLSQWSSAASATAITPQQFGAQGDGITIDTPFIQSAMDSICAKGGTIYFPATTAFYATPGGIQINGCDGVYVTGSPNAILKVPNGTIDTPYPNWPTFGFDSTLRIVNSSNIKVDNITIDGNIQNRTGSTGGGGFGGESQNSNILISSSSNVYVENTRLLNSMTDCIDSEPDGSDNYNLNLHIYHNYCSVARRNGTSASGQHGYWLQGNFIMNTATVQPLTCPTDIACAGSGVNVENLSTTDSQDVFIQDNYVTGSSGWNAIIAAGQGTTNLTISGNHVINNTNADVNGAAGIAVVSNNGINFSHNVDVSNNIVAGSGWWGMTVQATYGINIHGNHFMFNGLQGLSLFFSVGAKIHDNYFEGNGGGGIAMSGTISTFGYHNLDISNNIFKNNCTSAGSAFSLANFPTIGVACPAIYLNAFNSNALAVANGNTIFNDPGYTPQSNGIIFGGTPGLARASLNTCFSFAGSVCVVGTFSGTGNQP